MSLRKKSDDNRGANSRKQKTRSLIVPTTIVSDSSEYGNSPSPELKHRFSFRSFRRGRSLSKSRGSPPSENDKDYDDLDRCDTPTTSPLPSPPIRKSLSVVDFRSFCTKLHRHLTTGIYYTKYLCYWSQCMYMCFRKWAKKKNQNCIHLMVKEKPKKTKKKKIITFLLHHLIKRVKTSLVL